jgi:hypothetical protein
VSLIDLNVEGWSHRMDRLAQLLGEPESARILRPHDTTND